MQDEDFMWEKEPLQIPSVPPTVNSCPAISINYIVEVSILLRITQKFLFVFDSSPFQSTSATLSDRILSGFILFKSLY